MSFNLLDRQLASGEETAWGGGAASYALEEGAGSGLSLSLDSFCNSGCGEASSAIRWNGADLASVDRDTGMALWRKSAWVSVTVEVGEDFSNNGRPVRVFLDGELFLGDWDVADDGHDASVAVPADEWSISGDSGCLVFGARTGYYTDDHR